MRNAFAIPILLLLLSYCSPKPKNQPPVEEIWEKYLNTLGKKELLSSVKTLSFSAIDASDPDGLTFNTKVKYPDKVHMEITGAKVPMAIIFNGDRGIERSGEDIRVLSDNEIRDFKFTALIFPEMYFNQLEYQMTLREDTILNEIECYNVLLQSGDHIFQYLIDQNTFNLRAIKTSDAITEIVETVVIDSMVFLKSSKYITEKDTFINEVKNYQLNEEIPDILFNIE